MSSLPLPLSPPPLPPSSKLTRLLTVTGILVGPVNDSLLKITRLWSAPDEGVSPSTLSASSSTAGPLSGRSPPLTAEFKTETISGVRFSPLLKTPRTVPHLPLPLFNPMSKTSSFPMTFKAAANAIMLCHGAALDQVDQVTPAKVERNWAGVIPKDVW